MQLILNQLFDQLFAISPDIRYGHFFQLVHPVAGGHLSVAIEPRAQPLDLLDKIR